MTVVRSCRVSLQAMTPTWWLMIDDCTTTLLFPFVTNQHTLRYRNSHYEYFGGRWPAAPSPTTAPMLLTMGCRRIAAEASDGFDVVSRTALDFQGYITATCGFRDGYGFAFITNGYGVGAPTWRRAISRCARRGRDCD